MRHEEASALPVTCNRCNPCTSFAAVHESASGTKRTSLVALHMSAIGGKADMPCYGANARFSPKADIH